MNNSTGSNPKKMFITAAPIGAVPKYIDPIIPRFIPEEYISLFSPSSERKPLEKRLKQENWTKVGEQGMSLRINNTGFVSNDDVKKLQGKDFDEAMFWLQKLNWVSSGEGWVQPKSRVDENEGGLIISSKTLNKIIDDKLRRDVAVELSSQGWQVGDEGDMHWPHEQGESYFNPALILKLERDEGEFLQDIQESGWDYCGSGFWLHGRGSTPYLPLYPDMLVEDAYQSTVEGAAMVHLHTRGLESRPYYIPGMSLGIMNPVQHNKVEVEQYNKVLPELLDKNPSVILNLSTSARGGFVGFDDHNRRSHLKSYGAGRVPDVASFSPGAVIFQQGGGYENSHVFLKSQMLHMKSLNIRPETEVFNKTILDNSTGEFAESIRDMGTPALFMLVTGVDQYKDWPKDLKFWERAKDDSLIPQAKRKKIMALLKTGEERDKQQATDLTVSFLKPVVKQLRDAHPDSRISTLMPGNMQLIATEVALALDLDGVRIGLEDGLNVADSRIPGGVRRALGTADQVRRIKAELEMRGVHVQSAEELRDDLGMQKSEIKLFREIENILSPLSKDIPNTSSLPSADKILELLKEPIAQYEVLEDLFIDDVMDRIKDFDGSPEELAQEVKEIASRNGIAIRYFLEEADRYKSPKRFDTSHMYTVQPLNFMREVLSERDRETDVFDNALRKFSLTKGLFSSVFIPSNQFKNMNLRFLDFATFTSSRYNMDRTEVMNTLIRQDKNYSSTMAVLFSAIEEKTKALRNESSATKKQLGVIWYKAVIQNTDDVSKRAKPRFKEAKSSDLQNHIGQGGWVVVPSTPATNYSTGTKLTKGLTNILHEFLIRSRARYSVGENQGSSTIMSVCHSGRDENGEELIEASMLKNRFSLNTDFENELSSYSVQQIYDQLCLPRIIKNSDEIAYQNDGTAKRDAAGLLVSRDGGGLERLPKEDMEKIDLLKLIGHSSGIATVQQIDNLLREDLERYGFSEQEQKDVFKKSILVHFGTACDVHLSNTGTTVIDVTAHNDIRSIAGRTDEQIVSIPIKEKKIFQDIRKQSDKMDKRVKINNSSAEAQISVGEKQKSLITYWPVFLSDDPARIHDGHTIKRYVGEAPEHLKALVAHLDSQSEIDDPQSLIDDAERMVIARDNAL